MRPDATGERRSGAMLDGILIDEMGRRWPDRSWELVRRLGQVDPHLDLSSFAVRERGFIHIRPQENGARVALRVGGFGLETLAGALYELKERRFPRIILAMLAGDEWFYEMLAGAWEFAERAEHLIASPESSANSISPADSSVPPPTFKRQGLIGPSATFHSGGGRSAI